ncbi:MAG: nicotinamide mononucleotide transporter [Clostridiales bacterium]|nr:nicotinamide mononucleotide transporter [Clostridiales bacterium]
MKRKNPFQDLTKFEWRLWLLSVAVVIVSAFFSAEGSLMSTLSSLVGVTALIFVAKGYVLGQVLTVVFAVFYGIVSWEQCYYGEMITYLFMTAPMAICAIVSWMKHPYQDTKEVEVHKLTKAQAIILWPVALLTTGTFYFILKAIGNASLLVSTISITTSFIASYLTYFRSPYYAMGYAANDVVLIVLWSISAAQDISYLPMVACFVMFLANDVYGFFNWKRMQKRQNA